MTTSLITKSLFVTAGLTLICLPLLVMAQTDNKTGSKVSATTYIASTEGGAEAQPKPGQIEISKSTGNNSKQESEAVDPRRFQIEHSEEYWQLILQSLELRLRQQQNELASNRDNFKSGIETDRQFDLNAQSLETQAKIVEARLNIDRIHYERKGGKVIDSRRIPPASTAKLRPGEVLELRSLSDSTLNDPRVVVQADHTVTLALVGTISVKGVNPDELRQTLNDAYSQFIREPNFFLRRYSAYDAERVPER